MVVLVALHTGEEAVAGGGSEFVANPVRVSKRLLQLVAVLGTCLVVKTLFRSVPHVDRVAKPFRTVLGTGENVI